MDKDGVYGVDEGGGVGWWWLYKRRRPSPPSSPPLPAPLAPRFPRPSASPGPTLLRPNDITNSNTAFPNK